MTLPVTSIMEQAMPLDSAHVTDMSDNDTALAAPASVGVLETDQAWGVRYSAEHQRLSHAASTARDEQRTCRRQARKCRQQLFRADDAAMADRLVWADFARARGALRQGAIKHRLTHGFRWDGGPVGGNHHYRREPFHFHGLVSHEHPILQLFAAKLRRTRHLLVGDDKAQVFTSDSKLIALDAPYCEDNKVCCGVLRIEVDRILPWSAITEACRGAGVPQPNIAVGWADAQGNVHNPHLIWLLHASAPLQGRHNRRFRSLHRGVLRGLCKALLGIGADPGGLLNAHRHKNPLSPLWERRILAEQPYDLGALKTDVDVTVRMAELHAAAATLRGDTQPAPDHPDPDVVVGSNRLFGRLAPWARSEVVRVRVQGGCKQEFVALVAAEAYRLAAALARGDTRRTEQTTLATAKSVANWTWDVYKAPAASRTPLDAATLAERHAEGGRKTAAGRKARSEEVIVAAARHIAEQGRTLSQAAVLEVVRDRGVISERTIRRHWPAVQAILAADGTGQTLSHL